MTFYRLIPFPRPARMLCGIKQHWGAGTGQALMIAPVPPLAKALISTIYHRRTSRAALQCILHLLALGAKVEGDHHGIDSHEILGNLPADRQECKYAGERKGNQAFYAEQVAQPLDDGFIYSLSAFVRPKTGLSLCSKMFSTTLRTFTPRMVVIACRLSSTTGKAWDSRTVA